MSDTFSEINVFNAQENPEHDTQNTQIPVQMYKIPTTHGQQDTEHVDKKITMNQIYEIVICCKEPDLMWSVKDCEFLAIQGISTKEVLVCRVAEPGLVRYSTTMTPTPTPLLAVTGSVG